MSEIDTPFNYFGDPTKSRALFSADLYFGIPDTDPTIASNQKLVRAIQEDGTLVSLSQPVKTNSGGYPTFNGSTVRLDISGDYSFRAFNSKGALAFEASSVENPESGSDGFSGVVVIEQNTLSIGQTTVTLTDVGANESVFYLKTNIGDQGFLAKDIDYTVTNSTTIELTSSYNAGDIVVARQNDPTGQLVPVSDDATYILVLNNVTEATTAANNGNIVDGDTVTLLGSASTYDGLGGSLYRVTNAGVADGVNIIQLGASGLFLELLPQYYRFKNYAEEQGAATLNAATIAIDFDDGLAQTVTLTENVTAITFANENPSSLYSSTVTLRVIQDGTGGWTVTWPPSVIWPGGTKPTVTAAAGSIDVFGFTTYDGGTTWYGFTFGQDMK